MTQKVSIVDSGGYVQVREAIIRGSGPEGPIGPRGPKGTSIRMRGQIPDESSLPFLHGLPGANLEVGDAVVVESTGHLWSWYALTADVANDWHDAGRFRGNPGYLMSVMARCELAASYGTSLHIDAGTLVLPQMDIVHNDTELQGEGMAGVKSLMLGLSDASGKWVTTSTNCQYLIFGWPLGMTDPAQILTSPSSMGNDATYLITVKAQFTPSSSGRGIFTVRLVSTDFSDSFRTAVVASSTDDSEVQPETITLVALVKHAPGLTWRISVETTLSGKLTDLEFAAARLGGGYGPRGVQGDVGERPTFVNPYNFETDLRADVMNEGVIAYAEDTGNLWTRQRDVSGVMYWQLVGHTKGPAGNPTAGYASYDAIAGVTGPVGSEAAPGSAGHTKYENDQGLPYPNHSTEPHTPYFLKQLVDDLPTRLVSRFATWADFDAKRPSAGEAGEILYIEDIEELFLNHGHTTAQIPMILIRNENTDPPPADGDPTSYPDGTIWLQVKH